MAKFIKLTEPHSPHEAFYMNADHITWVQLPSTWHVNNKGERPGALINLAESRETHRIYARETPEQILALIEATKPTD